MPLETPHFPTLSDGLGELAEYIRKIRLADDQLFGFCASANDDAPIYFVIGVDKGAHQLVDMMTRLKNNGVIHNDPRFEDEPNERGTHEDQTP